MRAAAGVRSDQDPAPQPAGHLRQREPRGLDVTGCGVPFHAEFGDQRGDAARLGLRVVLRRGIGGVLVRLAEPAQIRRDNLASGEPGDEVQVVGAVARPTRAAALPPDRSRSGHRQLEPINSHEHNPHRTCRQFLVLCREGVEGKHSALLLR